MDEKNLHIAIFISFSGQGGVEKMIVNLTRGFLNSGIRVDMILARARGEHLASLPTGVRQIRLGTRHTLTALPGLVRYLRSEKPEAVLAVKDRAIKIAILARWLSGHHFRLVGRLGTTISAALEGQSCLRRWIWYAGMRFFYRRVDRIIAVSEGVADDIRTITGIVDDRVCVVRNPVVTQELYLLAEKPPEKLRWTDETTPLITGMGRLTRQKDFTTLIKAFALLRKRRKCRLLILGEGSQRSELESLISSSDLSVDVLLPGFISNPYPHLLRSSLFVLSSLWEGSPNSLTEAMSLGVPVVSTDCRSGPREILQDGRWGRLVPVGDEEALARAMEKTLDDHITAETLKEAVRNYSLENSVEGYLRSLGTSIR